jgi:hypothetical protein
MKGKLNEKELGILFGELMDKSRDELGVEFRVAESEMVLAERKFFRSLDYSQSILYQDYRGKKNHFLEVASKIFNDQLKEKG